MGVGARGRGSLAAIAVAAAVCASYAGVVHNEFVQLDDNAYVTQNPHVLAGLTLDGVRSAFSVAGGTYFHPLTWLSLMLDVTLFGVDPVAIHVVNVALHAATAVLLLLAFARATGRLLPSLVAVLLFAVHPITVESVAWATERKTVLSGALGAAAILAYVALDRSARWRRLAVVGSLLAAGLLAKPSLVVLPALLLILDVWPLGRIPLDRGREEALRAARPAVLEKLPLFAPFLAILVPFVQSARLHEAQHVSLPARIANAVGAVPRYLLAFGYPAGLSVFHPYPPAVSPGSVAVGALTLAAITAAVVLVARRRPWWAFGWAWFLVAISPGIGVLTSGHWPLWADRFAYIAIVGPCVAVAFEAAELAARSSRARAAALAAAAAAIVALGAVTHRQVGTWRTSVTLFEHAVEVEPESDRMRANLAIALDAVGRPEEALVHHVAAVRIAPEDSVDRFALGTALARAGRLEEAQPHLAEAVRLDPSSSDIHVQLGVVLQLRGRPVDAELQFRAALELEPANPEALFDLAQLLNVTGRAQEASPLFARFLEVAPPGYAQQRAVVEALLGR